MASRRELVRDRIHQALKRAQRRYLLADYEDLRLRARWLRGVPDAPWDERTFPVAPDLDALEKILVFKPDEIGDAVYALPALAELRRHAPRARISLVCRPLTVPLYERARVVDEIVTFEPGSRIVRAGRRRRLRASLAELSADAFDLAVYLRTQPSTFRDFRGLPARALLHPLDPRMRSSSVFRAPVSVWGERRRHMALQLLEIVGLATGRAYGFEDVSFPDLVWTDDDRTALATVFGNDDPPPFGVLHPFAKEDTRRYPEEYWPSLVAALGDLGLPWVVVGGREDAHLPELPNVTQAQGRLGLMQTAYLLSRASAFVGNISGPAHLSAVLGTPTVTLMSGYSLPTEWAPLGDSLVLRADVPCAPCHQATCPVYRLACLTELRPERVAPEVVEFLGTRVGRAQAGSPLETQS